MQESPVALYDRVFLCNKMNKKMKWALLFHVMAFMMKLYARNREDAKKITEV